jgi:uncharacterized protein (TIGR04551 family)
MSTRRDATVRLSLIVFTIVVGTSTAEARVGFGDPAETWREREADEMFLFDAHLRMRAAHYGNLDLDRGVSPSTGKALWPAGEGPLDSTAGTDMRVRLAPSFFFGDDVRLFLEVDLLDNITLGASPRGTPYGTTDALVFGTAFQEPLTAAMGAFRVRTAVAEARTPFGVLVAGRAPSHFGLGIAANAGDALDDDGGDRADRVAFVTPILGHFVGVGLDWAASGPVVAAPAFGPAPGRISDGVHGASMAIVRYHAPWEVELYRRAGRFVFDYGAAVSGQMQRTDSPSFYRTLDRAVGLADDQTVRRDAFAIVGDAWARVVFGPVRLEAEVVVSHLHIDNPSPWAGVEIRTPVTGNPFGAVVQGDWRVLDENLILGLESGVASADPSPGFPAHRAGDIPAVGRPGDVFGSQLDVPRDARMDAYRFNTAYRVDLILWRTLLGGVSEAAYGKAMVSTEAIPYVKLEGSAIYSHALSAASAPGGVMPLGVEVDGAATLLIGNFSLRTDAGVLFPLGGLGARGGAAPGIAHMVLVRLGYAT